MDFVQRPSTEEDTYWIYKGKSYKGKWIIYYDTFNSMDDCWSELSKKYGLLKDIDGFYGTKISTKKAIDKVEGDHIGTLVVYCGSVNDESVVTDILEVVLSIIPIPSMKDNYIHYKTERYKHKTTSEQVNVDLYKFDMSSISRRHMYQFVEEVLYQIPSTWENFLSSSTFPNVVAALYKIKSKGIKLSPTHKLIMEPFRLIDPGNVKVVIVGQDPYGSNTATGVPFEAETFEPPSLRNIRGACLKNVGTFGGLRNWYKQGVLVINRSFTKNCTSYYKHRFMHPENEHSAIWTQFDADLFVFLRKSVNPIFILFGIEAMYLSKYAAHIEGIGPAVVITEIHPVDRGFVKTKIFSHCNEELMKRGLQPIDW